MDQQDVDDDFRLAQQLHTLLKEPRRTREGVDEMLDRCRRRLKRRMTSITEFVGLLRYILEGRPQPLDILKLEELVELVSASTEGRAVPDNAVDNSGSESDTQTQPRRSEPTRTGWKKTYACRRTLIEKWGVDIVFYYGFHLAERSFTEAAITATYKHGGSFQTLHHPLNCQIWASIIKNEKRLGANRTRRDVTENFRRIVRSDMDALKRPTETPVPELPSDLEYESDKYGIICAYSWTSSDGLHYSSSGYSASSQTQSTKRSTPRSTSDRIAPTPQQRPKPAPPQTTRVLRDRRLHNELEVSAGVGTAAASTLGRRSRGSEQAGDDVVRQKAQRTGYKRQKDDLWSQRRRDAGGEVLSPPPSAHMRFIATIGASGWSCTSTEYDTLREEWYQRYNPSLVALRRSFQEAAHRTSDRTQRLMNCAVKWLGQLDMARIATSRDSSAGCDAIALSASTFSSLSELDFRPFRCVIIKGDSFNDEGCIDVSLFLKRLQRRYTSQEVEVQDPGTGGTLSVDISSIIERYEAVRNAELCDVRPEDVLNLLDLRDILGLAKPRALVLERFQRLLDWVAEGTGPGKDYDRPNQASRHLHSAVRQSVQKSLTFNLLGFTASFSGPHVDYLNGTWLRCVSGVKAWIIAVDLTSEDYIDFIREGNFWCPEGKTRIIILEAGDVLWMPPGILVIHSPMTIDHCLMYGGMMWDTNQETAIAANIRWIAMYTDVTNEELPPGLTQQMDSMGTEIDLGPLISTNQSQP